MSNNDEEALELSRRDLIRALPAALAAIGSGMCPQRRCGARRIRPGRTTGR